MKKKLPKTFLAKLNAVTAKRPKTVNYNKLINLVGVEQAEATIKEMIEKFIE